MKNKKQNKWKNRKMLWIEDKANEDIKKIKNKLQLSRAGIVVERMVKYFKSTKNLEELR